MSEAGPPDYVRAFIRVANVNDAAAIKGLDHAGKQHVEAIDRWFNSAVVLVAEADAAVVGYAVVEDTFFDRSFVAMLFVDLGYRRIEIGSALLDAAIQHSKTDRVFTSTNSSNKSMQGLLAKCGWTACGMVEGLDEGDPELFYFRDR